MPDLYKDVTKQNVTQLLYEASLINNTDVAESNALSNLICGVFERYFQNINDVQDAVNNGYITRDTYILVDSPAFAPKLRFVDTAGNILNNYL